MCRALLFRQYVHVDVKIDANLRCRLQSHYDIYF